MASPYLSERVGAAILRSMCSDSKKNHEKEVVKCMEMQKLVLTFRGEEREFSFAEVVDGAGFDTRGMFDDFFPRYPYRTTKNTWKHFRAWVTDGNGYMYKELCLEWIDLASRFLRESSSCWSRSHKPKSALVKSVFGPYRPYYVGERPMYMYKDDDHVIEEAELYPVTGGLVMENEGLAVKDEMDPPPGFACFGQSVFEYGGPSGTKELAEGAMLLLPMDASARVVVEKVAVGGPYGDTWQERGDPMRLDPDVLLCFMVKGQVPFSHN